MAMRFRPANHQDVEQIIELSRTSDRFQLSEYTGSEIDRDELEYWVDDDRAIVLVAGDDVILGYAYGVCVSPKWFFFDGFVVRPEARNTGVGTALYGHLVRECMKRGIQLIQGIVKDAEDSSLEYWVARGYETGARCIWVEHWIDE